MNKRYLWLWIGVVLLWSSCADDIDNFSTVEQPLDTELLSLLRDAAPDGSMGYYLLPDSREYDKIPQDPYNPITGEKVELGRRLFHETGLAMSPKYEVSEFTYSCSSCHVAGAGFQPGRIQGIADGGIGFGVLGEGREMNPVYPVDSLDIQPIRVPNIINNAYQRIKLWNGSLGATGPNIGTEDRWTEENMTIENHLGFEGVETQAIAGLTFHRMDMNMELVNNSYYRDLFDLAFPDYPVSERYTTRTAGLAIAAYERTILANQAPFQNWLRGDREALSDHQKQGAALFFGKAGCVNCHSNAALASEEFFALGFNDFEGAGILGEAPSDETRKGRGGFTGNSADDYKFKVPQLYSLKPHPFYGHGASFRSVEEIIRYKNSAVAENALVPTSQLAEGFVPLELTEDEIERLVDFVEHALNDDNMERYVPNSVGSGNCFPNNDPISQDDMGCN